MKKISLLIVIMQLALSIHSSAQLNYLFSTTTRPYVPVTGGITPHLITDYAPWAAEDEGLARIPIGFTFNYNHKDYTEANVSVNGFITLGDFFSTVFSFSYFINKLSYGPISFSDARDRPVLAPLWDDLLLADTLDLVYKTTGHAPFRVFTIEWKKAKWVYESLAPVLSIELRLYETTNIIEFHYKDEGSLPDPRYAFASIGITSSYNNRGFISLQNTSAHPDISMLRANDSLHVKPADNQVYRFIPSPVKIPPLIKNSIRYTNNSVSFNLQSGGFNGYEYALTHSPIPPSSGINTFNPNVTVSSLTPATTYYIYARSKWFGWFNSQWTCDSFTTAVNPVELPYIAGADGVPSVLPINMRQQDFQDTIHGYDPTLGWNAIPDFPGVTIDFLYYQVDFYNANTWLYTPGINLTAGKTYQLKFGYLSYFLYTPADVTSLEVKYGRATGAAAMTSGTLYKKTDISSIDFYQFFGDPNSIPVDTVIEFTPSVSGAYYFGFHDLSLYLQGFLTLDDISVTEKTSATTPFVLVGKTNNKDNVLNWATKDNKTATAFEVQRSADGINFTKIGDVSHQTSNNMRPSKNSTTYRVHRNTEIVDAVNNKDKHSITFDGNPGIELQQSDDGINFKKLNSSTSKSFSKADTKINYDYTDHNAKGMNYYRLQQVNKNGTISYSNMVILNNTLISGYNVYPNPAKDALNVTIPFGTNKEMTLVVTDVSGRTVISKVAHGLKGENNLQLDVSHLTPGMYSLKLICVGGCENAVMKFVKQ